MVSWFKRPGDKALPGNKFQLLRRYLLTCNCCKEDRSTLKFGEVPVLTDDDDDNAEPPPLPLINDNIEPPPLPPINDNVEPPPLPPIASDNADGLPDSE